MVNSKGKPFQALIQTFAFSTSPNVWPPLSQGRLCSPNIYSAESTFLEQYPGVMSNSHGKPDHGERKRSEDAVLKPEPLASFGICSAGAPETSAFIKQKKALVEWG